MLVWVIVALAVLTLGVLLWRLDRRMDRHGITADPVTGNPHVGQTSSPKTSDTGGASL